VEWHLSVRLLFAFHVRVVFTQYGALRIQADPAAPGAFENVREHSLFINLPGSALKVQNIGSVCDRNLAELAHGNHALGQMQGLVFSRNQEG